MKFHSLFLTALTALSLTLGGCSNDDTIKNPDGDGDGAKITFSIGVASGPAGALSRADEVGYDEGLDGENAVNDAMLIIYDRPINSTDPSAKIIKTVKIDGLTAAGSNSTEEAEYYDPAYYPQSGVTNTIKVGDVRVSKSYNKTIEIEDSELSLKVGQRYYATAVCNLSQVEYSKISALEGESLQELRDYVYKGKLYTEGEDIKHYTDFCMTGINEISFLWERKTSTDDPLQLDKLLVQRLAARLDVMLGENGVDVINYWNRLELAVFTENSDKNFALEMMEGKSFYLTDLKIIHNVDPEKNGTYLLERSSSQAPSSGVIPVYFDNEGWEKDKNGNVKFANASKYVYSYSKSPREFMADYSLKTGYSSLFDLIDKGTFYNQGYEGNKENSSIVGYLTENTNSSNYTVLRIEGYTNAGTSAIFQAKSRAVDGIDYIPDGYNKVIGDIPIRHSLNPNSDLMRYAVVRNTIYRVRIKVVARDNKIYFRYYYANGSNQDPENLEDYVDAYFIKEVGDATGTGTITPND